MIVCALSGALLLLPACSQEGDQADRAAEDSVAAPEPLFLTEPGDGDFVAEFDDPFTRIETRGSRVEIFDAGASPLRSVRQARRTREEDGTIRLEIPQANGSMVLEMRRARCADAISGEVQVYAARLTGPAQGVVRDGCGREA